MEDFVDSPNPSERRKENIKNWLKNPYNLILVSILIFAFLIRFFYFIKTSGQTLWWDEAEYGSTAKLWAFGVPYDLNPQRPPLFQFLMAILFKIGFGETFSKFLLVVVPSTFLVLVIYLLGKEMFDKRIGLIAAFLSTVSWTLVFWSSRLQPDFLSMSFQVLSIIFMWRYWKNLRTKSIVYSGIFAALGFYFKVSALLVPMSFAIFIFVKDRFSALKNKNYYYFLLAFLASLVPYFIWAKVFFGTITAFSSGYDSGIKNSVPFGWYNLNYFYLLTGKVLFILLIIGVILALRFLFFLDLIVKDKKRILNPKIFSLIVLAVVSVFYIFYIRGTEDRWVFLWLPFIFFLVGNALIFIYRKISVHGKSLAMIVVAGLLLLGGYNQLSHANSLIKIKIDSYEPVKLSGIWMKENSIPGDVILSRSKTQHTYYSERKVFTYNRFDGPDELDSYIKKNRPKFFVVSVFEVHPEWTNSWVNANQKRLMPVRAYFADAQKTSPLLIVYEIIYEDFT